jgi:hypothetical protein
MAASIMDIISGYYFDIYEGHQLRRSVLIRNAVKASSSSIISGSGCNNQNTEETGDAEQQLKDRWMLMAARSGIHPSDYPDIFNDEEEDEDDEVILLHPLQRSDIQVDVQDYYSQKVVGQVEEEQEDEWFNGLLEEVSTSSLNLEVDEDDQETKMDILSTSSLPSLIMDEESDNSDTSEEEGDNASIKHPRHSKTSSQSAFEHFTML